MKKNQIWAKPLPLWAFCVLTGVPLGILFAYMGIRFVHGFVLIVLIWIGFLAWAILRDKDGREWAKTVLFQRRNSKRYKELLHTLLHDHDPDRFFQETEVFLQTENLPPIFHKYARFNLGVGYLNKGEADCAIEIWTEAVAEVEKNPGKKTRSDHMLQATARNNLCIAYLEIGRIEQARYQEEILQQMQQTQGIKVRFAKDTNLIRQAKFLLAEGRYEEAKQAYEELLQGEKVPTRAIYYHFDLARIYEQWGDVAEQKRHLVQVAEHGNKHYKAEIAREKLRNL